MRDELLKLAERVEALTGPDDRVDEAIVQMAYDQKWPLPYYCNAPINYDPMLWQERHDYRPTHSLDAAMGLVSSGWIVAAFAQDYTETEWRAVLGRVPFGSYVTADAATGPLALTAAALRARAEGVA